MEKIDKSQERTEEKGGEPMDSDELRQGLKEQGYIADDNTLMAMQCSLLLNKPLLIEGPAGAGKTELAKAWSRYWQRPLIRLQCYEGIDEAKALYEWNYQKQLLYIQSQNTRLQGIQDKPFQGAYPQDSGQQSPEDNAWAVNSKTIYSEEFLLSRPLLKAIRSPQPVVLLIDEVDKSDEEFESFLLEILSDWQVSIPETGTISAASIPSVLLTSNNTRNLSHALRRRCLYLYLDYPGEQRELDILRLNFPELQETLGRQAVILIRKIRLERLKKHPSISEVLDWVNILNQMGARELSPPLALNTLGLLLKYKEDQEKIREKINQKDWFDGIFTA